mmetsp:Transcript_6702/g.17236  ORF Transcript_6702/g.17236 Transcript_6702/m.17236 type:complete len:524 (+) Transcript_6702:206-1777(+)
MAELLSSDAPLATTGTLLVVSAALVLTGVAVVVGSSTTSKKKKEQQQLLQDNNAIRIPHLSSMVPYVGSAIDMGQQGITPFVRGASQKLGDSPFFTATIMGDKCVFIADPKSLNAVFKPKYSRNLDNLTVQRDFAKSVLTMTNEESAVAFSDKVPVKLYHQFLFKGEELQKSIEKVQENFHTVAIPDLIPPSAGESSWTQHDLHYMVTSAIFKATMGPIISDLLSQDEAYDLMTNFDKDVIPIYNGFPDFLTTKGRQARSILLDQLLSPEFWASASPMFQARKSAIVDSGIMTEELFAKNNLGVLWASVGNSAPAIFWLVLLLVEHPEAWEACRKQVEQVVAARKKNSTGRVVLTLEDLDKLTLIDSAFFETLRLYQGAFTPRSVTQDFVIESSTKQNYLVEEGTKIMVWWNILHQDPGVFENPEEFQYDRFAGKTKSDFTYGDGKPLTHEPVIPFGGGEHLCPGRKFVSYEARLYVAMLMQSFDLRLVAGETRPDTDKAAVGIGVLQPVRDPKVEIRPRKTV